MPIKTLVEKIDFEDIKKIIEKYNTKKGTNCAPLEILNRCEGGFMIKKINYDDLIGNENTKIKQLRWKYKYLKPHNFYEGFNLQEEMLLYSSMREVLCDNVFFEE
jgi:hypothetical protein